MKLKPIAFITLFGINCTHGNAQVFCHPVYNQAQPGLEECTARINSKMVVASPTEFQKMSVWCWAASLSLIFTYEGHPISQNQIIIQNFGNLGNAPDGDFLNFENRLNRDYIDANGKKFTSSAAQVFSTEDAARSLSEGFPIIFKGIHHAIVQTSLTYKHTYESLYVRIDGSYWNPEPRKRDGSLGGYDNPFRQLTDADIYHNVSFADSKFYLAAWSISTN